MLLVELLAYQVSIVSAAKRPLYSYTSYNNMGLTPGGRSGTLIPEWLPLVLPDLYSPTKRAPSLGPNNLVLLPCHSNFTHNFCQDSTLNGNSDLGPVSRKPRKVFGPVKPFLDHLYLKNGEGYTPETSCMKESSLHL